MYMLYISSFVFHVFWFIGGFHQRHTDPMLRLRRRLVRVAPQHIALEASNLGQCWKLAVLQNLLTFCSAIARWIQLTLKRCQVFQQPSLARILANGFPDQLQLKIYGEAIKIWDHQNLLSQRVFEYLRGMWTTCRLVGRWAPTRRRRWQNSQSWSFVSFSIDNGRLCPLSGPKYLMSIESIVRSVQLQFSWCHSAGTSTPNYLYYLYIVCIDPHGQLRSESRAIEEYNLRARFLSGASAWNAFS